MGYSTEEIITSFIQSSRSVIADNFKYTQSEIPALDVISHFQSHT